MEAVRKIVDAEQLFPIIDLPESMKNTQLEIIILPINKNVINKSKKNMKGCLKQYADLNLIEQEKNAWERAAVEKYGNI